MKKFLKAVYTNSFSKSMKLQIGWIITGVLLVSKLNFGSCSLSFDTELFIKAMS